VHEIPVTSKRFSGSISVAHVVPPSGVVRSVGPVAVSPVTRQKTKLMQESAVKSSTSLVIG
jgi:hypothetical protein